MIALAPRCLFPSLCLTLALTIGCGGGDGVAGGSARDAAAPTTATARAEWDAVDQELVALETELAELRQQQRAEADRVLERAERLGRAIDALKRRSGVPVTVRPALPEVPDEPSDATLPRLAEDGSVVATGGAGAAAESAAGPWDRLFVLLILVAALLLVLKFGLGRWLAGDDEQPDRRIKTEEGEIRIAPAVDRTPPTHPPDSSSS